MVDVNITILEEFQSSDWGQLCIQESLSIAEDVLDESKHVYCFRKHKSNRDEHVAGDPINKLRWVFREGWAVESNTPNYYSMIGTVENKLQPNQKLLTLKSVEGKEKVKIQLPTTNWSLWYRFEQMFGSCGVYLDPVTCQVMVTNPEGLKNKINWWKDQLSSADGRPMLHVLSIYNQAEIEEILSWSPKRLSSEVKKLKQISAREGNSMVSDVHDTVLARGLNDTLKACRARLLSRTEYWANVAVKRVDPFDFAMKYSPVNDRWSRLAS